MKRLKKGVGEQWQESEKMDTEKTGRIEQDFLELKQMINQDPIMVDLWLKGVCS